MQRNCRQSDTTSTKSQEGYEASDQGIDCDCVCIHWKILQSCIDDLCVIQTDPPCPLPGNTKPLLFEQRLRSIRTGELTTLHLFEDSDDSSNDSNPFSDQEENYRDIISRLH